MAFIFLLLVIFLIIWHYRFKELTEKYNILEKDLASLKRRFANHEAVKENLKQTSALQSPSAAVSEEIKSEHPQSGYIQQPVNIPSASPIPPASVVPPMSATIHHPESPIISSSIEQQTHRSVHDISTLESGKKTKPVFEFEPSQPSSMEIKWQEFKNNVD